MQFSYCGTNKGFLFYFLFYSLCIKFPQTLSLPNPDMYQTYNKSNWNESKDSWARSSTCFWECSWVITMRFLSAFSYLSCVCVLKALCILHVSCIYVVYVHSYSMCTFLCSYYLNHPLALTPCHLTSQTLIIQMNVPYLLQHEMSHFKDQQFHGRLLKPKCKR